MTELDAAIFDLGGVLTTPVSEAFAGFETWIGIPRGALLQAIATMSSDGVPDYHLLEVGTMTEAEYYRRLGSRLGEVVGREVALPEDPETVRAQMVGRLRANDEMLETVRRIHRYYPVGLLTNNVREWRPWWHRESWAELFDVVIDSSEVGMRKPDPAIFRLATEGLGVPAERTAFVDDITVNIESATTLGYHAILFTTTEEVRARLAPLFPKAF